MERQDYAFGELDHYYFGRGTHYDLYEKLGAHPVEGGVYFAVWAPHAAAVSLVGDFNGWNEETHRMVRREPLGVFDCLVPEAKAGQLYKYVIHTGDGRRLYKSDPFANEAEVRPGTASRIADLSKIRFTDEAWLEKRASANPATMPLSIYELHPGSWKRHPAGSELAHNEEGFYNYRELAEALTEYVKDMHYTHVELVGALEHPLDASWGYQVTGYFAPTSRYGSPEDFAYFVNYLHCHDIGIILDWVPAHFPRDAHGLSCFDGEPLYEYADPRKGEQPQWGTKIFDYGKTEVRNFLISSALFWVEKFHIDGIRVDAVASMLYLDFAKEDGQWVANEDGSNENWEAVEFMKHMNSCIIGRNPGILMIAEESTTWPKVTERPENGGLGFTHKWNMGWMHDFLEYMKLDPYFRKWNHNKMTFGLTYAYSENYVLVLSHDEVVHMKGSMIGKMPGLRESKSHNLMAGYTFMIGHPGKKLLFMGQDFGQYREWSEARELDWYLLAYEEHSRLQAYMRELLKIYQTNPALSEQDQSVYGFEWINCDDASRSIISFARHSMNQEKNLLFVCNFTPVAHPYYRVGVPKEGTYHRLLSSDAPEFGGSGRSQNETIEIHSELSECDGFPLSIPYPLGPYEAVIFEF